MNTVNTLYLMKNNERLAGERGDDLITFVLHKSGEFRLVNNTFYRNRNIVANYNGG
jgi:hypothetical protein